MGFEVDSGLLENNLVKEAQEAKRPNLQIGLDHHTQTLKRHTVPFLSLPFQRKTGHVSTDHGDQAQNGKFHQLEYLMARQGIYHGSYSCAEVV